MDLPIAKIKDGWDHDLHVHSRWSLDIPDGPYPRDYLEIAESNQIHIGFLEHYEYFLLDPPECPYKEKKWRPKNTFKEEKWYQFLEEKDQIRSDYDFVSYGLEIDYYPNLESEVGDFIDDYGNEFDLLVGSLHETEHWRPVTIPEDLIALIEKHGSFEKLVEIYFEMQEQMIQSKLFNAVAHIDTIFRYCGKYSPYKEEYDDYFRTKQIADMCIKNNIWFEVNLSGYRYSIQRPFPPISMLEEFVKNGARIFVGSDSHKVETFQEFIPKIKETNALLNDLYNKFQ